AVLLDLSLGAENGLTILEEILPAHPNLPVVMITGYGTLEAAVKAIKLGAYDFLPKPLDFEKLYGVIEQAVEVCKQRSQQDAAGPDSGDGSITTAAPALVSLLHKAKLIGRTGLSVLIVGESGAGKELMAEWIHKNSARATSGMLKVNCSAFPEQLIDNELFGHEKGAFTGAEQEHQGLFEQADRGTLLLDEIGDLPLASQAKLLRVLEDGKIRRLGGKEDRKVDVRIIASTNRDLPEMIERRAFREDLFYRLNSAFIYVPPLRERREDIPLLINRFLREAEGGAGKRFSPEAEHLLQRHDWPGNVRELKNVVELCAVIAPNEIIRPEDLPGQFSSLPGLASGQTQSGVGKSAVPPGTLNEAERDLIIQTLAQTGNNKRKTSQRLGISYKTLYNKMKQHGID
ncbi:MAG: sigma-54 dependent transcriptional regulator, partial [Planctomycetes bacterium]|nr:sigma-54 dependent transcriptional regulator [Planctomycetota bacterium]